jgi:membrane fusion protein, multidrug efflux system
MRLFRWIGAPFRWVGLRRIILVLVVLLCAGLVWFNFFRSRMIGEFFASMPIPAVAVSTTVAEPVTWTPEIDAIGTLWARQGVDIASEVAGRIQSIEFTANDRVEQGQLLVQIDDAIERADLAAAQAAVERDRAGLERAEQLRETGVSSEAALEEAQTTFAASESTLERIRAVIDQKAIEAPFSGTIGIPRIDMGQYVQPGAMIATLQQLDTMRVDFTVPEQRMSDLKMGQEANFGLTEGEFPYSGRIIGIDPKIDPQTRMVSVRAEVENDGALRPGQFARVRVALPPVDGVIALPQTAVVTSLYGNYVYVVEEAENQTPPAGGEAPAASETPVSETTAAESGASAAENDAADAPAASDDTAASGSGEAAPPQDGPPLVARQTFVEIGRRQGNLVEILKGVEAGQTVVTSGQNKLANNTPVTINNSVDPAKVALEGAAQ